MVVAYERMGRIEISATSSRTVFDIAEAYALIGKLNIAIRECEKKINTQEHRQSEERAEPGDSVG